MKTLYLIECRSCGTYVHKNEEKVILHPWEEVVFSMKKIPRCGACKEKIDRTTTGYKRRIRPDDYRG